MILLVFVAQRLVVSDEDKAPPPTFPALISDISSGEVARATIKTESNEVSATLKDGTTIDTGYIPEDSQPPSPTPSTRPTCPTRSRASPARPGGRA